ncbi:MAG: ParB N-terminal domain-containing protein, partial [Proteobacteria bacterium]|nr:ParB N-terminal domain-containing protein [Pseudomonadota bacterium]
MKLPISAISIGPRHRKDMGDLVKLACSIGTCGLLQPVGITKDNELVFGHRRLLACKDILG